MLSFLSCVPHLRDFYLASVRCTTSLDFSRKLVQLCPRIECLDWLGVPRNISERLISHAEYLDPLTQLNLKKLNLSEHMTVDDEVFGRVVCKANGKWDELDTLQVWGTAITSASIPTICAVFPFLVDVRFPLTKRKIGPASKPPLSP